MGERVIAVGPFLPDSLAATLRECFRSGVSAPLVAALAQLVGADISGLIVYGSMAQKILPAQLGTSDVDLLVVTDTGATGGVFGTSVDVQVDLHVQTRLTTLADAPANWVYADGRVLWDARPPELETWLEDLRAWKLQHLKRWSAAERLKHRVWADRLVERIQQLSDSDTVQSALHASRLIAAIPEFHARLRGVPTTSMSKWWRELPDADPAFADQMKSCLSGAGILRDSRRLGDIVAFLFASSHD